MYKKLFSTNRIGFVLDTSEWLIGIYLSRNLGRDKGSLLTIGFLCFNLYIAIQGGKKKMKLNQLCKDNVICCDDNCKRCANLIYDKYMKQQEEIKNLKKEKYRLQKALNQSEDYRIMLEEKINKIGEI